MTKNRENGLRRNFKLIFWIEALTEMRLINVVSTLFMISRGLSLSQIFITTVVFSVVAVMSELPSSYLADKWSRKGLIIIAIIGGVLYWTTNMFAYGFWPFVIAISIFSISYSFMSGTDEALVYDSARELGETSGSMKMLGRFHAASRFFKMLAPLLAVLIAINLTDFQYRLILGIDLGANLMALFLADYLVEPKQLQKGEKIIKGVFWDSVDLFKNNPALVRITVNRTLVFVSTFIVWRVLSEYLTGIGVTLILIGITASAIQISLFVVNMKSHRWFARWSSEKVVSIFNFLSILFLGLFWLNEVTFRSWILALIGYSMALIFEAARWPFFSELVNRYSSSYNRATTISASNLFTEIIKLPALILCIWIVTLGYGYLFGATFIMAMLAVTIFPIELRAGNR